MTEESLRTSFVSQLQNVHSGSGYQGLFRRGQSSRGMNLTSYTQPNVRMSGAVTLVPGCLHGVHRDDFTYFTLQTDIINLLLNSHFVKDIRLIFIALLKLS